MSRIDHLCRNDLLHLTEQPVTEVDIESPLRLHCNENPWPPFSLNHSTVNRYPEQQPVALRQRLSEIYGVAPKNMLVTRGADDAIDAIIRGFCRPCHDSIVQCPPSFIMYRFFARLHQATVVDVPLSPESFEVDINGIKKAVDDGAKVVFLCSPNNPSGSLLPLTETLRLVQQVRDQSVVVIDEAYVEFCQQESLSTRVNEHPNLIILRTLSKAWSLAGARIGSMIACQETIDYLLRAVIVPYPLSVESVAASLTALEPKNATIARKRIAEIIAFREVLRTALCSLPFVKKVYPSHANFLLVAVTDAQRLLKYCRSHGILLRDQSMQPGLENHIRISVGTSEETERLVSTLQRYEEPG